MLPSRLIRRHFFQQILIFVSQIGALLSIGGAYPWWSLGIFFLCCWIVYGIVVFGEDEAPAPPPGELPRSRVRAKGAPMPPENQRGARVKRPRAHPQVRSLAIRV